MRTGIIGATAVHALYICTPIYLYLCSSEPMRCNRVHLSLEIRCTPEDALFVLRGGVVVGGLKISSKLRCVCALLQRASGGLHIALYSSRAGNFAILQFSTAVPCI